MNSSLAALAIVTAQITAPGPEGPLAGTLTDAGAGAPVVLVIPGSGPTDRDGNNPMGVKAAPYRLLAEALGKQGVSTVRIDKRGLFASKAAAANPNAVTLAAYADDVHSWVRAIADRTGARCVWLAGHSEGGLVALAAAQKRSGICGIILISAPGRKMGEILRQQLKANPANGPILESAFAAIAKLEAGERVDVSAMNPALLPLFAPPVQDFLIDLMAADPEGWAARVDVPMLIIHGDEDLQVSLADAEALHRSRPGSHLLRLAGMNHVLKQVPEGVRAANFAAYADPSLPIDQRVPDAIAGFVRGKQTGN